MGGKLPTAGIQVEPSLHFAANPVNLVRRRTSLLKSGEDRRMVLTSTC